MFVIFDMQEPLSRAVALVQHSLAQQSGNGSAVDVSQARLTPLFVAQHVLIQVVVRFCK